MTFEEFYKNEFPKLPERLRKKLSFDDLREIHNIALSAAHVTEDKWLPIETAQLNCELRIKILSKCGEVFEDAVLHAISAGGTHICKDFKTGIYNIHATHWQPLPLPPKLDEGA